MNLCSFYYPAAVRSQRITLDMSESNSTRLRHLTWESLPVFGDMMIFRFRLTTNGQAKKELLDTSFLLLKRLLWVMWFEFCPVVLRSVSGISIIIVKTWDCHFLWSIVHFRVADTLGILAKWKMCIGKNSNSAIQKKMQQNRSYSLYFKTCF